MSEVPSPRSELNGLTQQDRTRELAPGCLSSTGIYTLVLPKHFVAIGAHACDSCRLLNSVDLRDTMIEEIPEFTFGHCTSLREVFLPTTLHTIRVKAFMNCAALVELAIPPALKYIGSRAFLDCTALRRLIKMPGTRRWHGVYAEENAHDPRHGPHPWLRIEDHPSIHSCRGPAINFVRVWVRALARVRSRPAIAKQCSSIRVTNHSCPPLYME